MVFKKKFGYVISEVFFQLQFLHIFFQRQKIKFIRVFECFPGEVALWSGQDKFKIIKGFSLSFKQLIFNLNLKHISGPIVFNGFIQIEKGLIKRRRFVNNEYMLTSGNL